MLRRVTVKCSSLFFIVFLMCPRRIRPTAIGKEHYFYARRSNDLDEPHLKFSQNGDHFEGGVDDEPGFDLSDDEIRKFKLWHKGIIPYYIDAVSFNDKVLRDRIRSYLNSVNAQTRLSFLELPSPPKDDDTRWVFFANRRGQLGCADHSIQHFTNEGVQHVNLGYDCLSAREELAEAVLAIAGVPAQHNAPDRDEFITIVEENIIPDKRYLFQKLKDSDWLFHDLEYDFTSASQYHQHRYSANGQVTIEIKVEQSQPLSDSHNKIKMMEKSHGLSREDVQKLRMLYNYIVKKKENKLPECDKLFRKGQNFRNERPIDVPDVKPRKKPNKYLGLPEKSKESSEYSNSDKGSENEQVGDEDNGDALGADSDNCSQRNLANYAGTDVNFGKGNEDYKH